MNRSGGLLAVAGVLAAGAWGVGIASRRIERRYGRPPRRTALVDPVSVPADAADVAIVSVDGVTLRAWLRETPPLPPGEAGRRGAAAVIVHGWGGSAADMLPLSEPILDAGLHVLLLDARCHGRSDMDDFASMPTFADDIRAALAWLRAQPQIDPTRIALVGHSVGAGACMFVAAGDPAIASVVSLASMADPEEFMSRSLRRRLPGPVTALALRYVEHAIGHRFTEFAPVETIGRIRAPVLLLHGERDTVVPLSDAYRLQARAPDRSTLVVLPDADHGSVEALDAARPAVLRFLRDTDLSSAAR